jgi:ABC-type transporter Mla subunit MlaD
MLALTEATEALADHSDLLVDRVTTLEALGEDVTGVLGEELARLRAEVLHLQRVATSSPRPPA